MTDVALLHFAFLRCGESFTVIALRQLTMAFAANLLR